MKGLSFPLPHSPALLHHLWFSVGLQVENAAAFMTEFSTHVWTLDWFDKPSIEDAFSSPQEALNILTRSRQATCIALPTSSLRVSLFIYVVFVVFSFLGFSVSQLIFFSFSFFLFPLPSWLVLILFAKKMYSSLFWSSWCVYSFRCLTLSVFVWANKARISYCPSENPCIHGWCTPCRILVCPLWINFKSRNLILQNPFPTAQSDPRLRILQQVCTVSYS